MEDRREISWEEGEQFARDNGIDCFSEVSAKTGEKVDAVRTTPPQTYQKLLLLLLGGGAPCCSSAAALNLRLSLLSSLSLLSLLSALM
jgi:hypothetical protein